MKKINFLTVLLLATSLAFVSCEKPESKPEPMPMGTVYFGKITVSTGQTSYVKDSIEITVKPSTSRNSVDLLLNNVKFAEQMPAVTFTAPNIYVEQNADSNNLSAAKVEPVMAGIPLPAYTITNLSGAYTTETLNLTFTCMSLPVAYEGVKK